MRTSKKIKVGNTFLGGGNPVLVQSMLNVPSTDIDGSVKQAVELEKAGFFRRNEKRLSMEQRKLSR